MRRDRESRLSEGGPERRRREESGEMHGREKCPLCDTPMVWSHASWRCPRCRFKDGCC